jgi:hypothetical protein
MAGSPDPETRLYLQDAAGYFHTLDDFTGSILVLGVLGDDPAGTAAFSETYSRYGADATLRFLGVPTSTPVGADTPFPTMRNRDSTLMETRPGEFSIVSPSGIILARGDLEVSALDQAVAAAAGHTAP